MDTWVPDWSRLITADQQYIFSTVGTQSIPEFRHDLSVIIP